MAVHHQPHLLDFSAPPPAAFDNSDGLLALQHVDGSHHMPAAGGSDTVLPPWPQAAVSLSLFNSSTAAGASLVGGHQQQPFTVAQNYQLHQVPAANFQQLRSSRYLGPVKELLSEFCSLEGDLDAMVDKRAPDKAAGNKWDDVEALSSSSGLWGSPSLSTMDPMELERRKTRLLSMVEQVDRRYRRYREQMRVVEVSFEAVAGAGAAQVYTRLARQAMSRHFRNLRDALAAQVRALRKAVSERDGGGAGPAPAGATKGDTPRLRVLDQCLRRQRAFQQPGAAVENYPWRQQRGLPERAVAVLRAWLLEHFLRPYPNDVDKRILARQTGLSKSQVLLSHFTIPFSLPGKNITIRHYIELRNEAKHACFSSDGCCSTIACISVVFFQLSSRATKIRRNLPPPPPAAVWRCWNWKPPKLNGLLVLRPSSVPWLSRAAGAWKQPQSQRSVADSRSPTAAIRIVDDAAAAAAISRTRLGSRGAINRELEPNGIPIVA